jgi:transposase
MLDEATRAAILKLSDEGHGARSIARALGRSRNAVRKVIADRKERPPNLERAELAEPHRDAILELYAECKGNLIRVHEELVKEGAKLSYQALTAFCRRHSLVKPPPPPAGRYDFEPGEEMQHDTSPHDVQFADGVRKVQTASLVFCHSRMMYVQMYPRFTRFQCKQFLTEAFRFFGGVCGRIVIDNTHVVVLSGTGKEMKVVPEMEAFAERFGIVFMAHEKGDADRKGRVERPFHYIENNFLAGRTFADFDDLNRQALAWCEKANATFRRHLHATPRELFASEKPHMRPLPLWVPEPYVLHHRIVSVDGYVMVHRHSYSAPFQLLGRRVEVREMKDRLEIYDGPRLVGKHAVVNDIRPKWITDPNHRPTREEKATLPKRPEEERLRSLLPGALHGYLDGLKKRANTWATRSIRELLRMVEEYPGDAVIEALGEAAKYGLYDLERVERMILSNVRANFFRLSSEEEENE